MDKLSEGVLHEENAQPPAAARPEPAARIWIVPHTHWDREWYMPFQVFRLRLVRMVDELMDILDADPSFPSFTLDGQAVVLEDYLEARPASEKRLSRLIREGRIKVGPSYVLPDEYLVGQESLVRNLLLGRQVCRRFGREMPVGYFPDTFGHVAQMPQILRGFGIDSFVFWRGLGDEGDRLGNIFLWKAPDGSSVLALRQIDGYGALSGLGRQARGAEAESPEAQLETAVERLKELYETCIPYMQRSATTDLLACNGTDHRRIQPELPRLLAECAGELPELDLRIASIDEYVDAVRSVVARGELDTRSGELCDGRDAAVLRGVNSTRMPLKQRNEAVERALLEAETASSLALLAGGHPYPIDDLRAAWRYLLQNHPHDTICGCSVDEVHRDMAWRFDNAEQLAMRLRREALWHMAGGEAIWSYRERPAASWSAVNLLPWTRRGLIEITLPGELSNARTLRAQGPRGDLPVQMIQKGIRPVALVAVEAPAFGGTSITVTAGGRKVGGARLLGQRALENEHYRVDVLPNGTLDLLHKATGRSLTGALWFEDDADRGDEYNFCAVEGELPWDSRQQRVKVRSGLAGPAEASITVDIETRLPSSLRPDRQGRRTVRAACKLHTEVRLIAGVDRVEFSTTFENTAQDHRLRAVFLVGPASVARAEGHYAVLRRRVGQPPWGPHWAEPPASTNHTLGAVEAAGVAVYGRGLPEYEVRPTLEGTEIALTLLRCVGWLSRDDLSSRPGHAGPPLPTPEAQCIGSHTFEYALDLVGEIEDAELVRRSQDYRHGLLAGPAGVPAHAALGVVGEGCCFAALKGAEDGEGAILRLYNPAIDPTRLNVKSDLQVTHCRLDEEPHGCGFDGNLPPGRIASLRLRRRG